jgi:hypothetical protein
MDWGPGLAHTNGAVRTTLEENFLTRCSVSGGIRTADCRRAGAERSTFRWLPSTPLEWPMVTREGHVFALENGGG